MVVKSKDVKGHKVKKIKPIKVCKVQSHSQNKKAKEVKYHQQPFAETLKLFLEYVKEYGTLIVPKRRVYKDYNLGPWCQQMRSKRRLGILPEEQIKALDEIGFIWDVLGYKWENDMERYRNYVAETGIYDVTATTVYCGFRLGYWYKNLKIARRNGTFSVIHYEI